MPTIIHTADRTAAGGVAFNFDDMAAQARHYLDNVRGEAEQIVADAHAEAEAIRAAAQEQGRRAGMEDAERMIAQQVTPVLPVLRQAAAEIEQARQAWLAQWEARAVHVAAAIAQRVIRRELSRQPDITLALVREALDLATGAAQVRIHLHPADHSALGSQVRALTREMASLGQVEVIPDPAVTRGGCRVETAFGTIDQQIETQLARIEEELTDRS